MADEMNYINLNNAPAQDLELIPHGTIAKVMMKIIPGGYDDMSKGWTDGYATQSGYSGSVYLKCEFNILEGKFKDRKVYSLIGLHSDKGPKWKEMGESFMRAIMESKHGLSSKDYSEEAEKVRNLRGFYKLDNILFVARVDITKDINGASKNEIKYAITADHTDYTRVMNLGKERVMTDNNSNQRASNASLPKDLQVAKNGELDDTPARPQKKSNTEDLRDDDIPF